LRNPQREQDAVVVGHLPAQTKASMRSMPSVATLAPSRHVEAHG
jgi:hypothetical protein